MSCCGNKREEIRQRQTMSVLPTAPPPAPPRPRAAVVFTGTGSYLATGPYSRAVYYFSSEQREQLIDAEDAAGLVSSGFFRLRP